MTIILLRRNIQDAMANRTLVKLFKLSGKESKDCTIDGNRQGIEIEEKRPSDLGSS